MQSAAAKLGVETFDRAIRVQVAHSEPPGTFKRFKAATGLKPKPRIVSQIVVGTHGRHQV